MEHGVFEVVPASDGSAYQEYVLTEKGRGLVKRAREALPELKVEQTSEWMGHRPALPDTVPVMGPSAKHRNLWYAAGHGHLGLTYGATTARLMADLITGVNPPVDMKPYRVDRF